MPPRGPDRTGTKTPARITAKTTARMTAKTTWRRSLPPVVGHAGTGIGAAPHAGERGFGVRALTCSRFVTRGDGDGACDWGGSEGLIDRPPIRSDHRREGGG